MRLETLKQNFETLKKDVEKIKNLTDGSRPTEGGSLMSGIRTIENTIEREENAKQ